ncbi:MAG: PorT family protein [Bacteroidales bacterium]|nr:PorT family protein [Bacteroidales bacterium]
MKKIILIVAVMALSCLTVSAKGDHRGSTSISNNTQKPVQFGIILGGTIMNFDDATKGNFHFSGGIGVHVPLPLGFSVQPQLLYTKKATSYDTELASVRYNAGYVEIPIGIQWGPDLLVCRPYIEATPFLGFAVDNLTTIIENITKNKTANAGVWDGINRFEFGASIGAGLEVWHLQISYHYSWNFGDFADLKQAKEVIKAMNINNRNFRGHNIHIAFFF